MKIKNIYTGALETVWGTIATYSCNGATAIQLWCEDGPYATLTVNVPKAKLEAREFIVDTNNCPWASTFLIENEIALPTTKTIWSGYCEYPIFKFTVDGDKRVTQ